MIIIGTISSSGGVSKVTAVEYLVVAGGAGGFRTATGPKAHILLGLLSN